MFNNPFKKDKPEGDANVTGDDLAGARAGEQAEGEAAAPLGEMELLQQQLAQLRGELGQAQDDRQRALADYVNFQRRSVQNERDAREAGVRSILHSVMPVIDHFDMALNQDAEKASAKSVLEGVTMIKGELLRALSLHGATAITPGKGDAFDPNRHKAIAQVPGGDVAPGAVVTVTRVGFVIGDRVVRPAEVVVAAEV